MFNRVQVGNSHRVGNHRACARAPSRTNANPPRFGPANKVGNNQEVAREAHLEDDTLFKLRAVEDVGWNALTKTSVEPLSYLLHEPRLLIFARRGWETRHVVCSIRCSSEGDFASLCNLQSGVECLREFLPGATHVFR